LKHKYFLRIFRKI